MSFNRTQQAAPRPYSIAGASIDRRLADTSGRGSDHAKLLWLVILSHTPWDGAKRPTWASNETLAHEAGLGVKRVEEGLARLKDAAMLSTKEGKRPGARRPIGRVLIPHLAEPVKVLVPDREAMARIWEACRALRARPAALVTLAVGMHVVAAHEIGRHPDDWALVPGSTARLRRFVGASRGSTFANRLHDLEQLGLIRRTRGLQLAPSSGW